MMDLGADLPVTLVIKAPNQRVGDQTVECMLGWTVRKLKQHLTNVYPSKPKENHQKLIYSGKLLTDDLTLKEVLRQFEDGSNKHTVHLVCASSPQSSDTRRKDHSQSSPAPSSSSTPHNSHSRESSSSSGISEIDGIRYQDISEYMRLRRRGQGQGQGSPSQSTTSMPSTQSQQSQNVFNPYLGQFPQGFGSYPGGVIPPEAAMMFSGSPASGMAYSPEQYVWMQQMYAQYMAQYMQYYQQGVYPTPPGTPATPTADQPANQNVADQQDPQMNAGGGDIDDDEEFGQRDWLDYVYTFCRFMVLMGIVYFYSNFARFFLVFAFFFLVYLYQTGWFRFRRQRQQEPEREPEDRNQQQQQQTPQNNTEAQENTETDTNTESTDNSTEPPPPPPEPEGPGAIKVVWTFFSTFFTSLIPSPPPAVNAN